MLATWLGTFFSEAVASFFLCVWMTTADWLFPLTRILLFSLPHLYFLPGYLLVVFNDYVFQKHTCYANINILCKCNIDVLILTYISYCHNEFMTAPERKIEKHFKVNIFYPVYFLSLQIMLQYLKKYWMLSLPETVILSVSLTAFVVIGIFGQLLFIKI